jgi:hypothetical protein
MQTEQVVVTRASLPKEGTRERQVYDTLLAAGLTFTYSDYFERVLWLSQFHRALHNLKHRFEIEIEEAPDPQRPRLQGLQAEARTARDAMNDHDEQESNSLS